MTEKKPFVRILKNLLIFTPPLSFIFKDILLYTSILNLSTKNPRQMLGLQKLRETDDVRTYFMANEELCERY